MDFLNDIRDYTGPKWVLCITGGGESASYVCTIPGSSKVVEMIMIPYSNKVLEELFGETEFGACSLERTNDIFSQAGANVGCPMVVNAALETSRYRRGLNHAYIQCNWGQVHITLPKLSLEEYNELDFNEIAELRARQDAVIGTAAMLIMLGHDLDDNFVKDIQDEAEKVLGPGTAVDIIQFDSERKLKLFPDPE